MDFFDEGLAPAVPIVPASPAQGAPAPAPAPAAQQPPTEKPGASLKERGAAAVAAQEAAIEERLAANQKARREKDAAAKKAAADLLASTTGARNTSITSVKAEHRAAQQASEKLRDELTKKGALWPSVLTMLDLTKPNTLSKKGTELMRSTFLELQSGKAPVAQASPVKA
jgi:hypothetical protein